MVALLLILLILFPEGVVAQNYTLPAIRKITWIAGSDLWNSGTLPVYAQVTCLGLVEDGVTDDTTNLQNCINDATAGTNGSHGNYTACHAGGGCGVFVPAGTVFINGIVHGASNVAVRGAGVSTVIFEGASGQLNTQNWSRGNSSNLNPTTSFATIPSTFLLSGTPQKGDTSVTTSSGTVAVGTWMKIFGNDDPSEINNHGCDYCGDNSGAYLKQQFVQVTAITSGTGSPPSTVTLSQPLYFTPYTTSVTLPVSGGAGDVTGTEPAGAKYNIIGFNTQKFGYENMRVVGHGNTTSNPLVFYQGCLYCWAKGLEIQYTGANSNGAFLHMEWTYGMEVRQVYLHEQRSGASGSGYGIWFQFANGNAKIELAIVRHSRHGIIWEGGGGGDAILYSYSDDNFTDDMTYLGSSRPNHGAHPYMQLFEGDIFSHIAWDDLHGSSSYDVAFRNLLLGDGSNDGPTAGCAYVDNTITVAEAIPSAQAGNYSLCTVVPNFNTNLSGGPGGAILGFDPIDIFDGNTSLSFAANVLGRTGMHAGWSAATLTTGGNNCCVGTAAAPFVYVVSTTTLGGIAAPSASIIRHGNWDFLTNGVAFWDGGAIHTFDASWYYTSGKPAFLGSKPWPLIGPDVVGGNLSGTSGLVNTNPAWDCYWNTLHGNTAFDPNTCFNVATTVTPGSVAPARTMLLAPREF